ncbi:MAG: Hpt domain-containing protein [Desulfobacteraceae bacterium]|nr:Hpt domain-containing protein [Desulfobacteraceae bacterium]
MMSDLRWNREFALEQTGGDQELLAELLGLLRNSSAGDLQKIEAGLSGGDAAQVAAAAHSIKGAAASLGVEGLRLAAHEIEKQGRENRLAEIDGSVLRDLVSQLGSLKADG